MNINGLEAGRNYVYHTIDTNSGQNVALGKDDVWDVRRIRGIHE